MTHEEDLIEKDNTIKEMEDEIDDLKDESKELNDILDNIEYELRKR